MFTTRNNTWKRIGLGLLALAVLAPQSRLTAADPTLWELTNENKEILRISTFIHSAQSVSTEEGLNSVIDWCKKTGVTRVYINAYNAGGYTGTREVLERARARFEEAGIEGAGGIVTTGIGKSSSTGSRVSCYTAEETRKELQDIFEFTASVFDLIMIDDWFFTNCECEDCQKARGERQMSEYRCDLMVEVSREYILKPAKAVNPNVKVIIKYPLWYDNFHRRGYDVLRQSALFDLIWAGNESRDYDFDVDPRGEVQYQSYFNMRWIGSIGGAKTGGGWFDALATTPKTYLEQARQTVLGDAKEMVLCGYAHLIRETNTWGGRAFQGTGIANVEAFRSELPGLFELAKLVRNQPIKRILATKPANSDPYDDFDATRGYRPPDAHIYDFVGMLGLPLVPSTEIDTNADAAFFPFQVLKDPTFPEKLRKMLSEGKPVLITDKLAERLGNIGEHDNVMVLPVKGDTPSLLKLSREELNAIRDKMLEPIGMKFDAPGKVGLYLMGDDIIVIENFNDEPVDVRIDTSFSMKAQVKLVLPQEESIKHEFTDNKLVLNIPPRTLVAIGTGTVSVSCSQEQAEEAKPRPNILFIAVDDLRPELSFYGENHIKSPTMDKLAEESMVFNRAYCNVPVYGASRVSLLTGARPTRFRFLDFNANKDEDLPDAVSLPMHFKDNGYNTISNGKVYHHTMDDSLAWNEIWRPDGSWREYLTQENIELDLLPGTWGKPYEIADVEDDAYRDGQIANKGIEDLRKLKNSEEPFFLALGFKKPHLPFNAPRKYWDMYDYDNITLPPNYIQPETTPSVAFHNFGELRRYATVPESGPVSDEMARKRIHGYYACVSYIDALIGRVLAQLEDLGLADDTIVVLWGDHGFLLGEQMLWCKHSTFEKALRVPLVIKVPGKTDGTATDAIVEFIDIYPTLCDLAGIEKPEHLAGESLVPVLDGGQMQKDYAVAKFRDAVCLIEGSFFYSEWTDDEGTAYARMLFDHQSDPMELNNLSEKDEYQGVVKRMPKGLREKWGKDFLVPPSQVKR